MSDQSTILSGIVLNEETTITLAEICQACDIPVEDLASMIEEGLVQPSNHSPNTCFPALALQRLHTALRLQKDLEVNLPGLALILDLLEEVEQLRARLRTLEYQFEQTYLSQENE